LDERDINLGIPEDAYTWMLTTVDNPYSPFTKYDDWYAWDIQSGYDTCGLLARIAVVSPSMSDEQVTYEVVTAMREICDFNLSGVHKITKPTDKFLIM